MRIQKTLSVGFLIVVYCLGFPGRALSAPSEDRLSLRLFGGAGYHLFDDISHGIEGWNALWHHKWHRILDGEFRPFHWGVQFGAEFVVQVKPGFAVGFETGVLRAGRESRRTVQYDDGYYRSVSDETLDLSVRAIPLIANGTFRVFPGKRLSFLAGLGLGCCLGTMDWRYRSISPESDSSLETRWKGHSLAPVVQLRTGIELKVREGLFIAMEALGRFARLRGLKGRLDANGEITEDAFFWYDEWGYNKMFFRPEKEVAASGNIRKGVADLSGVSLRAGIRIRLK